MSSDETGSPPPFDIQGMFSQIMDSAQQMQGRMKDVQSDLKDITVEGRSGGGIVTVTASGAGRVTKIRIDPVAVDSRDVEMLEDLVVAAVNDALKRAQEEAQSQMGNVTGGLDMGGLEGLLGNLGNK
jgi:nucleoid-associated protein EbfC